MKLKKKVVRKTKTENELTKYSSLLDLNISDFTDTIVREISQRVKPLMIGDDPDVLSIQRSLVNFHGVDAHLRAEYRRIKSIYLSVLSEFEIKEMQRFSFARQTLNSKATEKQIKEFAYNGQSNLFSMRTEVDEIEQKLNFVQGMIKNCELTLSSIQSLSNMLKMELGVSKSL